MYILISFRSENNTSPSHFAVGYMLNIYYYKIILSISCFDQSITLHSIHILHIMFIQKELFVPIILFCFIIKERLYSALGSGVHRYKIMYIVICNCII